MTDSFLGMETSYAAARVCILPAPYDATVTYRVGARDGPRAILAASQELELYDPELRCEPASAGIHTCAPLEPHLGDPAAMVERTRQAISRLLDDGKWPLLIGGEHTLSVGAVAACLQRYPDLRVLYLDAHADLRDEYLGARHNHASALRRILDLGVSAAHVGLRSLSNEEAIYLEQQSLPTIWASEVSQARRRGQATWDSLLDRLSTALGPHNRSVYVSIDLDVFDPSLLPAVGTPEPGGLDWEDVSSLLRTIADRHTVIGADVMELAPAEGPVASAFTAAKLAYKLIGYSLAIK